MSLGIAIKSAEGIVLAADSRVTIMAQAPPGMFNIAAPAGAQPPAVLLPATYDNATKLLSFHDRPMGAITFGAGTIGMLPDHQPRTANSYLTQFEQSLPPLPGEGGGQELQTEEFARRLGRFFMDRWAEGGMPEVVATGNDMIFYIGGLAGDEPVGRLYELAIPSHPEPTEQLPGNNFGAMWGGQREIVDRILQGFDPRVLGFVLNDLQQQLPQEEQSALYERMRDAFNQPIPWPLLPLQDCVHIAVFLVKATIALQGWSLGLRGVGGAVEVATITKARGFQSVTIKEITAEPTP